MLDPVPPDSTATKARLLDAAVDEFAEHGLAGARVDRIAERAGANKRLLYVYFGNKEELFDLVVGRAMTEMAQTVPFAVDDLPGYAGALFDYLVEHPKVLRLSGWRGLERPVSTPAEERSYAAKLEWMAQARVRGVVREADPADLLALIIGATTGWFSASPSLHAGDPLAQPRLAQHRAELVESVGRMIAPARPASSA